MTFEDQISETVTETEKKDALPESENHTMTLPPAKSKEQTLGSPRPLSWQIVRILGFFFTGWNGLQIIFLPSLLFIILNNETMYSMFSALLTQDSGFLPLMLFLTLTFILILFKLHLLTEMEYRSRLNHYVIPWKDVPIIMVNYGIPLIIQYLTIMLFELIVLAVLYLLYKLLLIWFPLHIDLFDLLSRLIIIFVTLPWVIMQFMMDTTLERAVKGRSFIYCRNRARYLLNHKSGDIFRYIIVRFTLIIFSFVILKLVILLAALPIKIYLFYHFNINTNIIFGHLLSTWDVMTNAGKLIFGMLFMGLIYAPIATPLYWLNTRLIRSYLYRSGQI